MTFEEIINQMGVELIVCAASFFFGFRLIITRDVSILRKEHPETIKHPREYALYAGMILIFFGVAALIMGIVSFKSPIAALVVIIAATFIMGILWKKMHEKYG